LSKIAGFYAARDRRIIASVDTAELARIEAALLQAIGEAKVVVKERGVGPQFTDIVRHAREMHDSSMRYALADLKLRNECGASASR
jgi:hypothetical protein